MGKFFYPKCIYNNSRFDTRSKSYGHFKFCKKQVPKIFVSLKYCHTKCSWYFSHKIWIKRSYHTKNQPKITTLTIITKITKQIAKSVANHCSALFTAKQKAELVAKIVAKQGMQLKCKTERYKK